MEYYFDIFPDKNFDAGEVRELAASAGLKTSFRTAMRGAKTSIVSVYASNRKDLYKWVEKNIPDHIGISGPFTTRKKSIAARESVKTINNMKEEAEKIFSSIVQNKPIRASKNFKDAIDNKLKTALEVRKVGLTSDIYNRSKEE